MIVYDNIFMYIAIHWKIKSHIVTHDHASHSTIAKMLQGHGRWPFNTCSPWQTAKPKLVLALRVLLSQCGKV